MTKELKDKIFLLITDSPTETIIERNELTDKISAEVDFAFGKALMEGCQFGEICEAVGLKLVSTEPPA